MILEANDVEDAREQVGRPPLVSNGLLLVEFDPVEKRLRGGTPTPRTEAPCRASRKGG
jgi:hypothetical protein